RRTSAGHGDVGDRSDDRSLERSPVRVADVQGRTAGAVVDVQLVRKGLGVALTPVTKNGLGPLAAGVLDLAAGPPPMPDTDGANLLFVILNRRYGASVTWNQPGQWRRSTSDPRKRRCISWSCHAPALPASRAIFSRLDRGTSSGSDREDDRMARQTVCDQCGRPQPRDESWW